MDEALALSNVREALGEPPRDFGFFGRLRLRVSPPSWMKADDPLRRIFRDQAEILAEGDVYWGALVQANSLLFQPGPNDHPAMIVYSAEPSFEGRLDLIRELGQRLFALKGTSPNDPEQRRLADQITGEMDREFAWDVPRALSWGRQARCSSLMIFRKHLPVPLVVNGWFPILVHPRTGLPMVVPSRYWPAEVIAAWDR